MSETPTEQVTSSDQGKGAEQKRPRGQRGERQGTGGGISVGQVAFAVDADSGNLYPVGDPDSLILPRVDGTHLHPSDNTGATAARPRIQAGTRIVIY